MRAGFLAVLRTSNIQFRKHLAGLTHLYMYNNKPNSNCSRCSVHIYIYIFFFFFFLGGWGGGWLPFFNNIFDVI